MWMRDLILWGCRGKAEVQERRKAEGGGNAELGPIIIRVLLLSEFRWF